VLSRTACTSFHDAAGDAQVVSPDAIAQTFDAAGASVKLVALNACFTEPIAEALLAHVDCVVGMSGSIHDDAARSFAIGFYGGLGEHESIAAAFEHGRAAIRLDGLPDAERPRLKVRNGFNAAQLILAAVAPSVRLALPCPYPGMRPYSADDATGFHGRDAEISRCHRRPSCRRGALWSPRTTSRTTTPRRSATSSGRRSIAAADRRLRVPPPLPAIHTIQPVHTHGPR